MSRARMLADDRGASSVEYGLIVFAIAAAVVVIVVSLGGVTQGLFVNTCETLRTEITDATCSS